MKLLPLNDTTCREQNKTPKTAEKFNSYDSHKAVMEKTGHRCLLEAQNSCKTLKSSKDLIEYYEMILVRMLK